MKPKPPRERTVEACFRDVVRDYGAEQRKITSPGRRGVQDRYVFAWRGRFCVVELKRPGGRQSVAQKREHTRLTSLGVDCFVLSSKEEVDWWADKWLHRNR